MRGVSGAYVSVQDHMAVKTSCDDGPRRERLHAQFDWLVAHRDLPVVEVWRDEGDGYVMERLEDWRHDPYYTSRLIAPAETVWTRPAEVELDVDAHTKWVADKYIVARWSGAIPILGKMIYVMDHASELTRCLTHGDLTRVNTMMQRRGQEVRSVLIDPIPATPACADVWAFDLSKLAVSLLGYEHVMYGWEEPSTEDKLWLSKLLLRCNYVELECVRYMGVLQIMRMLPYHPKEKWDGLIEIAHKALFLRP